MQRVTAKLLHAILSYCKAAGVEVTSSDCSSWGEWPSTIVRGMDCYGREGPYNRVSPELLRTWQEATNGVTFSTTVTSIRTGRHGGYLDTILPREEV